ncbi:MAG: hemolysin III family protein [Pseudomonadales bacterium]
MTRSLGRPQSRGEEIANAISHGCGALASIAAIPILVVHDVATGTVSASALLGVVVFGVALTLLYTTSTLYHALPHGTAKRVFRRLDHSAIYVLIAGTYTPFALGIFREAWGWALCALIWAMAGAGILVKSLGRGHHPVMSSVTYLSMGWLALLVPGPLLNLLPTPGLVLLVSGGFAYTLGVLFFVLDDRLRYAHFVWHAFVLLGSACHFAAVLLYA